jgi:hypothetical protein
MNSETKTKHIEEDIENLDINDLDMPSGQGTRKI